MVALELLSVKSWLVSLCWPSFIFAAAETHKLAAKSTFHPFLTFPLMSGTASVPSRPLLGWGGGLLHQEGERLVHWAVCG